MEILEQLSSDTGDKKSTTGGHITAGKSSKCAGKGRWNSWGTVTMNIKVNRLMKQPLWNGWQQSESVCESIIKIRRTKQETITFPSKAQECTLFWDIGIETFTVRLLFFSFYTDVQSLNIDPKCNTCLWIICDFEGQYVYATKTEQQIHRTLMCFDVLWVILIYSASSI